MLATEATQSWFEWMVFLFELSFLRSCRAAVGLSLGSKGLKSGFGFFQASLKLFLPFLTTVLWSSEEQTAGFLTVLALMMSCGWRRGLGSGGLGSTKRLTDLNLS